MRDITYYVNNLVPGIYLWWQPAFSMYLSKSVEVEGNYSERIKDEKGFALILPNDKIWTSYKKPLDNN